MEAIIEPHGTSTPDHVPHALVRDVDLYAPPGIDGRTSADIHTVWKGVQDSHPPVFWTPRYGGHWIATRYAEIEHMLQHPAIFSSEETFIPRGVIPDMFPVCLDPPDHGPIRKLLMPAFSPKVLTKATDRARAAAIEIIERIKPTGGCEFVHDFAGAMPIIAFLTLIDLPEQDQGYLRNLAIYMSSPAHPKSAAAWEEMSGYVREKIAARRQEPRDDLITSLLHADVGGKPLTDDEVFSLCLVVVGGGLDTVVSMTSFAACHLAQHGEIRQRLVSEPDKLGDAVEEITRRFGTSNLGRLVAEDTVLGEARLRRGDLIVGIFPAAGLDERVNDDPMTFDLDRKRRRHLAFGTGAHTCIGNNLARRELRIFLEEWMSRIPDFHLAPGTQPVMTTGVVNSMESLHLSWPT